MLFSRAPRLLWRSFESLVYIAPWASAWGAFAFQSGPYMRTVYGFFIFSPHYAREVQVSSGLRPRTRARISSFFKFLRPCAHAHKRFNVSRHSRFSPLVPNWDELNQYSRGTRPNLGRLKGRLYIHLQSCDKLSQLKHGNRGAIAHDALCCTDATNCRIGACKTVLQALLRPGAFLRFKEGFSALCGVMPRAMLSTA